MYSSLITVILTLLFAVSKTSIFLVIVTFVFGGAIAHQLQRYHRHPVAPRIQHQAPRPATRLPPVRHYRASPTAATNWAAAPNKPAPRTRNPPLSTRNPSSNSRNRSPPHRNPIPPPRSHPRSTPPPYNCELSKMSIVIPIHTIKLWSLSVAICLLV